MIRAPIFFDDDLVYITIHFKSPQIWIVVVPVDRREHYFPSQV